MPQGRGEFLNTGNIGERVGESKVSICSRCPLWHYVSINALALCLDVPQRGYEKWLSSIHILVDSGEHHASLCLLLHP